MVSVTPSQPCRSFNFKLICFFFGMPLMERLANRCERQHTMKLSFVVQTGRYANIPLILLSTAQSHRSFWLKRKEIPQNGYIEAVQIIAVKMFVYEKCNLNKYSLRMNRNNNEAETSIIWLLEQCESFCWPIQYNLGQTFIARINITVTAQCSRIVYTQHFDVIAALSLENVIPLLLHSHPLFELSFITDEVEKKSFHCLHKQASKSHYFFLFWNRLLA